MIANMVQRGVVTPWIVTFCASGFFFYQFMLINIFNALNEPMLKEFSISATQMGHVSAGYFVAGMLSLFVAGIILDRYSVRKVIICAFSVSLLSTYLFGVAPSPVFAMLARFIAGISGTFCFLGPMKIATRWFPSHRLALVIGLIVSYAMLGGIIAQTPITLLSETVGWRYTSIMMATGGILLLLLIIWKVEDFPSGESNSNDHPSNQTIQSFLHDLKLTIANTQNWLGGLYISLINLPIFILGAMWGILYLNQVHHLTRVESSYVTSMIFVGMIFGSPFWGWLSDQMKLRKQPMMIFGILCIIPFIFLLGMPQHALLNLMLLFFAIGFLIGVQVIGYPLVAESNPKELNATAQGLVSTVVIIGGLTQPLFAWILSFNWDHQMLLGVPQYTSSKFNLAMMMMPIAILIAVGITFLLKETNCK